MPNARIMQAVGDNSLDVAIEALGGSIARWTEKGELHVQVGYESPSQFSREYNRLFGAPPLRDISKLRQVSSAGNA